MSEKGESKPGSELKVCVVGAGAGGLCAARHLAQHPNQFVFQVFEQTSKIGGIWNYTDSVGLDENGRALHTSMYKNMKTNLPIEIMEFQDFPSESKTSFVSHTEVLKYLEDYSKHFDLYKFIKFNFAIIRVLRNENFWKVMVKNLKTNEIIEDNYDSILVCNGRYSKPMIPKDIKGMETFEGKAIHSHDYRVPEVFQNQTVLVLGAGPSGIDIALEVSQKAKQIVFCHQNMKPFSNFPKNIKQELTQIKHIFRSEVEFESGNRMQINAIIWATGYQFDFSFLDPNCAINVNQFGRVEGIYMHLVNQTYPSMAILGIPSKVDPFPLYHQQILYFLKSLTREVLLPTKKEMQIQTQSDLSLRKSMGLSERHSHKMVDNMFIDYSDKLAQMANIQPFRPVIKKLFIDLDVMRKEDLNGYKNLEFTILSDQLYVLKKS